MINKIQEFAFFRGQKRMLPPAFRRVWGSKCESLKTSFNFKFSCKDSSEAPKFPGLCLPHCLPESISWSSEIVLDP